jgi:hypothetical protein
MARNPDSGASVSGELAEIRRRADENELRARDLEAQARLLEARLRLRELQVKAQEAFRPRAGEAREAFEPLVS